MANPLGTAPHSSVATRAHWRDTYEETPYKDLPWFSPDPSPEVVQSVKEGFFPPGRDVLDIGCGAGTHVLYLASKGYTAHGVDLSPGAVQAVQERARKAGLRVDVREGDALALPFSKGSLAGALDHGCFHTLPFRLRKSYVAEVFRVLRPGGSFLLSWTGRETTFARGPPHRPSLAEVTTLFEPRFLFLRTAFRRSEEEPGWTTYCAWLTRRTSPQPPRR